MIKVYANKFRVNSKKEYSGKLMIPDTKVLLTVGGLDELKQSDNIMDILCES